MGSETPATTQLPKIDFSALSPADVSSDASADAWSKARQQVVEALTSHGCFEAVYPQLGPELRRALLDVAMEELFALPVATKAKNSSEKPFHGYLGQIPFLPAYESLSIMDAPTAEGARSFTTTMWPQGNPKFEETVQVFSRRLAELDDMVMTMVFESLGISSHLKETMAVTEYLLKVSEYKAPAGAGEGGKSMGLIPHRDKNTSAIICQNQVDGLEIETKGGEWYTATPSPESVVFIAGDSLRAWTNGRVYSPLHKVVVGGVTRHTAILFAIPNDNVVIRPHSELVDADHPAQFKPYDYGSYVQFCFSEEGQKANPQLDAFCGLKNMPMEP